MLKLCLLSGFYMGFFFFFFPFNKIFPTIKFILSLQLPLGVKKMIY